MTCNSWRMWSGPSSPHAEPYRIRKVNWSRRKRGGSGEKIYYFISWLIIGFVVFSYSSFSDNDNLLTEKDFEVAGLKFGIPVTEIPKVLGKAQKVTTDKKKILYYYYSQLLIKSFYFEGATDRTVDHIVILDKKVKTFRGIGVGDKEKDVFNRYGKTEKI